MVRKYEDNMVNDSYSILFAKHPEDFELMQNTGNALALQFNKPIKYDLKMPHFGNLKRLASMWEDYLHGKEFDPERVNCCFPDYPDKRHKFSFDTNGKIPLRVENGLELCFNKFGNKYDTPALESYLGDKDLFSKEEGLYRIRDGKREELEKNVKDYFNRKELDAFNDFGEFADSYVNKLDGSAELRF